MTDEIPDVTILLLGDEDVGKSTLLSTSRLSLGLKTSSQEAQPDGDEAPPPYELPRLRDMDQPFEFNIRLYNRPYRFSFYDTASPSSYSLLRPDFLILCFDISRPATLASAAKRWKHEVESHFNYDESLPVMLLGLKRDLRSGGGGGGDGDTVGGDGGLAGEPAAAAAAGSGSAAPYHGLRVAQDMRCDRYAECSALTGELCREVLEDIARTAARTTTEKGAKSEPANCRIM